MVDRSVGRASRNAFALTFIALLLNAALGCWTVEELFRSGKWVTHTYEVIGALEQAFSTLKDAETSVRGYLLTSRAENLARYDSARESISGQLRRVADLTADNPVQIKNAGQLTQLASGRFEALAATLRASRAGSASPQEYAAEMARGADVMEQTRRVVEQMSREEAGLLEHRLEVERRARLLALLSSLLGFALGVALVGTSVMFAAREVRAKQQAAESLAQLNEQLEERVGLRTRELSLINDRLSKEVVERRRAEHAAQDLATNLQRSNQELERFASVASHDLQEPLRKIQAFGDRLQAKLGESLGEQGRDYVSRMLHSAERMRCLIDDLLAFSRVSTKGRSFVSLDLNQIVSEVLNDLETRVQDSGADVQVSELPSVLADPLQIRQLLQNLIGNALKFRRPSAPLVVKVEGKIIPSAAADDSRCWNMCELRVSDNGIGFEEHYLDRIFEVFQRLHGRSEYEGTGMGLAICRRIVERHGGSITARSAPGVGSTFIVLLPAAPSFAEIP